MMRDVRRAPLAEVRAELARVALALPMRLPDPRLGAITLHRHQRIAVARLAHALASHGGALLADDVGLGKTFVALALAGTARQPVVVAPAALRDVWTRAGSTAAVACPFVSVESLSRPTLAPRRADALARADLIIVDEAHHLRNPHTRRWRRLAALARHARLLLLSATPIHNAAADVVALLALFLGERASTLDAAAIARLVVRRRQVGTAANASAATETETDASTDGGALMPRVARTRWHRVTTDAEQDAVRDALLALPPAVPPRDGGDAGPLAVLTLLRLLASSEDALHGGVRRRLVRAEALDAALRDGRHLDGRELRVWCPDPATLQFALALDGAQDSRAAGEVEALRAALAAHVEGLRALLVTLGRASRRPHASAHAGADWLRTLRTRHRDRRIVAFTQFADTARALYARLAADGCVALLSAAGGRIASGPLSRRDLLARFAPLAAGLPPPPARERIDLLIATDCLSEGLDLRDAGVVVHLDIPWTPARLAQRVGRAARLGAPHARVLVYGLAPPTALADALRLAARLRAKGRAAARLIGATATSERADTPARRIAIAARLERWLVLEGASGAAQPSIDVRHQPSPAPLVAAVRSERAGFLAACRVGGAPLLLAARGERVRDEGSPVAWAVRRVQRGLEVEPAADAVARALRTIARWARRSAAERTVDAGRGRVVTRALVRADALLAHAPAHRRAALAVRVAALREALAGPVSAGVERVLEALASTKPVEVDWLDAALAAIAAPVTPAGARESPARGHAYGSPDVAVHALVLLLPRAPASLPPARSNHPSPRPV
jgi:superfamily II DNA or RNA helicase